MFFFGAYSSGFCSSSSAPFPRISLSYRARSSRYFYSCFSTKSSISLSSLFFGSFYSLFLSICSCFLRSSSFFFYSSALRRSSSSFSFFICMRAMVVSSFTWAMCSVMVMSSVFCASLEDDYCSTRLCAGCCFFASSFSSWSYFCRISSTDGSLT